MVGLMENKKIKWSCEVPKCLLNELVFNYYYCLPHLMDQDEEYREFFLKQKGLGNEIYLDNSIHELGKSYNEERLLYWINELVPSNFFIPDVWEDKTQSIVNARKWVNYELPKSVEMVAVVQAKSLKEAIECTQIYKDLGYKKLAYSYGASYYNEISNHPNKDLGKALGRIQVISKMYEMGVLTDMDRIHLLGTACPFEFSLYKDIKCIESIDSSNPIMSAIEGTYYTNGIHNKPKSNMNTCFDIKYEQINGNILMNNLIKFKQLINNE